MGEIRDEVIERIRGEKPEEVRERVIQASAADVYWRYRREGRSESVALHYAVHHTLIKRGDAR